MTTSAMDLISRMRTLSGTLSRGEQKIADFVLAQLDEAVFLSQKEIAEKVDVSIATVNRFSTRVGCSGFREFKLLLAQNVAVSRQYLSEQEPEGHSRDDLTAHVFDSVRHGLELAQRQLEGQPLDDIVSRLSAANRIVFMGVGGGSANLAREGANRFFRLGLSAVALSDGYEQRMMASTLASEDVLFAISSSGQPAELIDSVSIARQYGATTVSLTKAGSKLANSTHLSVQLSLPESSDIYKPSASRQVMLAIIDVLATGTARLRPDEAKENLRRIRTSLLPLSGDSGPGPIGD